MEIITKHLQGDNAIGRLNSGEPIDDELEIKLDIEGELRRFRFRLNFTGTKVEGKDAIQATIRSIPVTPPPLEKIGLSRDHFIYKNFFPMQGLVVVTGPTGSGKSTLMASCVAELLREEFANRVINTYEAPIEFVYDEIDSPSCLVTQSSVPQNCSTFKKAIENSLRRKPEIIIVGEMRDAETIAAAIEAAQTGHLVIGTSHTNGVPETIRRLINTFGADECRKRWPFGDQDINHLCPGDPKGTPAERIAYALLQATQHADICIDVHSGAAHVRELPQVRCPMSGYELELARTMSLPVIWRRAGGFVDVAGLVGSWRSLGKPALRVVGGRGITLDNRLASKMAAGLLGLLSSLGVMNSMMKFENVVEVTNTEIEFHRARCGGGPSLCHRARSSDP